MDPALFFWIASALLTIALAAHAWNNGVASLLWGVIGAVAGIAAGVAIHLFAMEPLNIHVPVKLAVDFVGGLTVYLIVRWAAKAALSRLFGIDGPLHAFCDGFPAAGLSLIPSLLTIIIVALGLRIGGTLNDLRRFEMLAAPNKNFLAKDYPRRPLTAEWRDGTEATPGLRAALDWIEPLGRLPERQLTALLNVVKKPALLEHLSKAPETGSIVTSSAFRSLMADPAVKELNTQGRRIELLRHPGVRAAALNPELAAPLETLALHRVVDDFLLSPEWQATLESYRRTREDTADPDRK